MIVAKFKHEPKAQVLISVTELGIVTEVKPLHPKKVEFSIILIVFGIVIEVIPLQ